MTARVLVVVEQLRRRVPGGIGRYTVGLLEGLRAQAGGRADAEQPSLAESVTLYASRAAGATPDPLARFGFEVQTSRLPGRLLTRAWDHGLGAVPPGHQVVHAVSLAVPPLPSGKGGRPALCVAVHDLAWRRYPEATTPRGRRWHEAALRRALDRADAVVVPSVQVADELSAATPGGPPVTVIRWGADHLPPADGRRTTDLLAGQGVEGPYVLSVGTLEPRKNLGRLVDAYRRAVPSLPEPWPLLVAGPRGWGEGVPGASPEGPGRVVRLGPVDDEVLAGLYAGARLFAYVPLAEGYGFPPVEAMAAGAPVVAGAGVPSVLPDTPGPSEPAALVVDPEDVDAMAEAIVVVATDEERRRELVRRGRELVAARTWSSVAGHHRRLWDGLA